jgi:peptidoglycan/xylan/chitin deacetylase (PgdA/CDA1 family)
MPEDFQPIRRVVFTFDDGPDPATTPRLLDILRKHSVHAIFFVVGSKLESESGRAIVRQAGADGHTIGNHSYSHTALTQLSPAEIASEIRRTQALIESVTGGRKLLRPPYGSCDAKVMGVAGDLGFDILLWNVDTHDWEMTDQGDTWEETAVALMHKLSDCVVLAHDDRPNTVDHFELFIEKISNLPGAWLQGTGPERTERRWKRVKLPTLVRAPSAAQRIRRTMRTRLRFRSPAIHS